MLLDRDARRLYLRVVYAGPPQSGKTQTLRALLGSVGRGDGAYSAVDATDRTPWFEWAEYEGGLFQGHRLHCQIVAVPGHDALRDRRRALIAEADVVVLVVDGAQDQRAAARQTLAELQPWLVREGLPPIDLVLQCNKHDRPGAVAADVVARELGLPEGCEAQAASALRGDGVRALFVAAARACVRRATMLDEARRLPAGKPDVTTGAQLLERLRAAGAPATSARTAAGPKAGAGTVAPPPPRPPKPVAAPPPPEAPPATIKPVAAKPLSAPPAVERYAVDDRMLRPSVASTLVHVPAISTFLAEAPEPAASPAPAPPPAPAPEPTPAATPEPTLGPWTGGVRPSIMPMSDWLAVSGETSAMKAAAPSAAVEPSVPETSTPPPLAAEPAVEPPAQQSPAPVPAHAPRHLRIVSATEGVPARPAVMPMADWLAQHGSENAPQAKPSVELAEPPPVAARPDARPVEPRPLARDARRPAVMPMADWLATVDRVEQPVERKPAERAIELPLPAPPDVAPEPAPEEAALEYFPVLSPAPSRAATAVGRPAIMPMADWLASLKPSDADWARQASTPVEPVTAAPAPMPAPEPAPPPPPPRHTGLDEARVGFLAVLAAAPAPAPAAPAPAPSEPSMDLSMSFPLPVETSTPPAPPAPQTPPAPSRTEFAEWLASPLSTGGAPPAPPAAPAPWLPESEWTLFEVWPSALWETVLAAVQPQLAGGTPGDRSRTPIGAGWFARSGPELVSGEAARDEYLRMLQWLVDLGETASKNRCLVLSSAGAGRWCTTQVVQRAPSLESLVVAAFEAGLPARRVVNLLARAATAYLAGRSELARQKARLPVHLKTVTRLDKRTVYIDFLPDAPQDPPTEPAIVTVQRELRALMRRELVATLNLPEVLHELDVLLEGKPQILVAVDLLRSLLLGPQTRRTEP